MAEKQKPVRFNFFGVEIPESVKDEYNSSPVEIISRELEKFNSITSGDFKIKNIGNLVEKNGFLLGGLIKTKTAELPFRHNYETGEIKPLDFEANEGLGVPTHFLLDRELCLLMFQTGGVGIAQWKKFMEFNYKVQLETPYVRDPKNWSNVLKMNYIKNIKVKVKNIKEIQQFTKLNSVINPMTVAEQTGSDYLSFTLSSNNGMTLGGARQLIQAYHNLKEDYKESITIEGKDEEKETTDIFDLVTNRFFDKVLVPKAKNLSDIPTNVIFDLMVEKYQSLQDAMRTQYKWSKKS